VTLSALDFILLFLVVIVIVKVTLTGFVTEFFSKAAVIIGGAGAVLFYKVPVPYIVRYLGTDVLPEVISFLAIFLALYLAVKAVQQLAGTAFENESMNNLDRALGFFLGIAEGFLLASVIVVAMGMQPWLDLSSLTRDSFFARVLEPLIMDGSSLVPGLLPAR